MRAAASEKGCNLLMACGIGLQAGAQISRPAWPIVLPESDFVPVGPWNVDGLIVAPQRLTNEQRQYIQDLMADRFPIVFTTTDMPGPAVAQDNHHGVQQAVIHLVQHGHRSIAYIAGHKFQTGDYAERLQAYMDTLKEIGLKYEPRLVAYGECSFEGGYEGMKKILAAGLPFTAVVTNNDRSGFGAVKALREAGWRVPEDKAIIGFDNTLESQAHSPAFTTVHNSKYTLGYRLVDYLIQRIESKNPDLPVVRGPTHLVIRQSCNCQPSNKSPGHISIPDTQREGSGSLVQEILDAVSSETLYITQGEVETWCRTLVDTFTTGLQEKNFVEFDKTLNNLLLRMEKLDEDPLIWQRAIAVLIQVFPPGQNDTNNPSIYQYAQAIISSARLEINEKSRIHTARKLFWHKERSDRLSSMTAELLAVKEEGEIQTILANHLEAIHVCQLTLLVFEPEGSDPVGRSRVLLHIGRDMHKVDNQFSTRQYPLHDLNPEPYQLALLPIIINADVKGCAIFDTADIEICGAVVQNLASALRNIRLYREAIDGRRLAEEANQLKSRFLSMVSHELRTPLNMIVGLSEILLRQKSQSFAVTESHWQDLERIYRNAQQLGWLIGDVLDLASSEAGQLHLIREPLDLIEVMQVIIKSGEQLAREKGLEWETHLPDKRPWVLGEATRLRQVALNFISNAIKFTDQGKVTFSISLQEKQVVVAVSDTGLGVPVSEQNELFNEFQRSGVSVRRGYGGIGLGLTISKQLIELHQGTVGMYSLGKEGGGSTFFFILPSIQPHDPASGPENPHTESTYTIAYLTENEIPSSPILTQLGEKGINVHVYLVDQDPLWLLQLLGTRCAAIILDEHLASHMGWVIFQILKRHASTEHIPVIMHSYKQDTDMGAVLELNYLQKPLSTDRLAEMLNSQDIIGQWGNPKRTILVVDDDPQTLDFHAHLIHSQIGNCEVICARSGIEAVSIMREKTLDLVLLDLMMPGLDGFGVLESMQVIDRARTVPVIVVTAKTLTEADLEQLNKGVVTVLSKGIFNSKETVDHMMGVLSKNRTSGSKSSKLVRRALAFIHAHYSEPINRDQIARFISIDPDYLTVCFNQELGIPTITYLNRYRVNQAKTMLEKQEKNITEIALEVGFSDSAYFSRVFLRETGITPRAYQKGKRVPD